MSTRNCTQVCVNQANEYAQSSKAAETENLPCQRARTVSDSLCLTTDNHDGKNIIQNRPRAHQVLGPGPYRGTRRSSCIANPFQLELNRHPARCRSSSRNHDPVTTAQFDHTVTLRRLDKVMMLLQTLLGMCTLSIANARK